MFASCILLLASVLTYQELPSQSKYNGIENAPVYAIGPVLLAKDTAISLAYGDWSPDSAIKRTNRFWSQAQRIFAFDTLRVVVSWAHPTDGLGVEDSTTFRIKASKAIRFTGGGTVAADVWRYRKSLASRTADTFKVHLPVGDSVFFEADSIRQCRGGKCSVPGNAVFGFKRTTAPPAMTFIQIQIDSL